MARPSSARVRRVLAAGLTLGFVGACDQIIGVPVDPGNVGDAVARVCTCADLALQGDAFTGACDAGLAALSDSELVAVAEAGCTRCPDGPGEFDFLSGCYAQITGAIEGEQVCSTDTQCASFACCATNLDVVVSATTNEFSISRDQACCTGPCEGCATLAAHPNLRADAPAITACADGLALLLDAFSCACAAYKDSAVLPKNRLCYADCGDPTDTLGIQCKALDLECRNCLISAFGAECPQLAECAADPDRPIVPASSP